ncbi:MAG: GNAT family N-acetyltransferase, partial [Candidatus Lambdaproteobacteria bacterium]|nr:GNAT family N-acetyltransferase [Candidatus Lambdaproteobacteria bacterium]
MNIADLTVETQPLYFQCLEDWSDEMQESGDHKARWYEHMKDKGLGVKLALDERGVVGGMIQYVPIEHAIAEGEGLYMILCIWVHGHRQGRGNFQKRGMGSALLAAAEADARRRGAKGMAAWGIMLPFWMKASWFRKHGYVKADRSGMAVLLWKKFADDAQAPRWLRPVREPEAEPGKVCVTAFVNGWCPGQNIVCERARRACEELGERVEFRQIDTLDDATRRQWGIA